MESSQSGIGAQAQEKAQQVAEQTKENAQQAAGLAKSQVRSQIDQRSVEAGERLSSQASDIRTVARQLREQGKDQPARLAEMAAERADSLGGYLKESDADRILRDVEDFGRRQPMAVLLGGLAVGFAASRLLKASSRQRFEQRGSEGRFELAAGANRPGGDLSGGQLPPVESPSLPPTAPPAPATRPAPAASPVPPVQSPPSDPARVEPAISPTGGVLR
jgi:hypothetical protein